VLLIVESCFLARGDGEMGMGLWSVWETGMRHCYGVWSVDSTCNLPEVFCWWWCSGFWLDGFVVYNGGLVLSGYL